MFFEIFRVNVSGISIYWLCGVWDFWLNGGLCRIFRRQPETGVWYACARGNIIRIKVKTNSTTLQYHYYVQCCYFYFFILTSFSFEGRVRESGPAGRRAMIRWPARTPAIVFSCSECDFVPGAIRKRSTAEVVHVFTPS